MNWLRPPHDPAEALLWRTRIRLSVITLLMVATLVVVVGITTAVVATELMRQSVDRALDAAARDALTLHELLDNEHPSQYTGPLGVADTFVTLVDADGNIYRSTSAPNLPGLPDLAAIEAATTGDDRRTGTYGEASVRLLTMPYRAAQGDDETEDGAPAATTLYLQAGHDLSLEEQLESQLLLAIGVIGLLGILGALLVTLFITRRALVPIREAFETERRFVADASHELRTPVSIIRASAEILEREGLVDAAGKPLVDDIVGETDRMGRLVGDLMALASAQAGAIAMDFQPVKLDPYFEDIARRSASIADSRAIHFEAEADDTGSSRWVRADRDRLDQLLLILVDNAFKHAPSDGHVRLHLGVDAARRVATISVADDGPGIRPEETDRIFEPFERLATKRGSGDGAGLGLAIARQLARRHDADLSVESPPGEGATFRLRLPLMEAGRAERPVAVGSLLDA